jgi:hypothetical protein
MALLTPNMSLPESVIATDSGLVWEQNLNAALSIVDQHNHSPGSGVQINPAGLNINSDLPINANNLTLVRSVRFAPQSVPLSGGLDIGVIYESGVDLYYNDGSGNQIRITQAGSVAGAAGTITGLPSGTASASFGASTFTFQAATLTAANLDAASIILRNGTASSFGLTLEPPNAMAYNYTLTLPTLPLTTSFMTMDALGNMGTTIPIASGIDGTMIAVDVNLRGAAVQANAQNIVTSNTNATVGLSIIRGIVNTTSPGTIITGEGFTVTYNGVGDVTLNWTTHFADVPAVTTSCEGGTGPNSAQPVTGPTAAGCRIWTMLVSGHNDAIFNFIAIGQKL